MNRTKHELLSGGVRIPLALTLLCAAAVLGGRPAAADCPGTVPDVPGCACLVTSGDWPLFGVAGDVPATAQLSLVARTSCLKHRGQPYWQIQIQNDEPELAHFAGHRMPELVTEMRPQAWCTETVAYWHRRAGVPYAGGYRSLWYPSSYVDSARDLKVWYETEEELLDFVGLGRWIDGQELDYDNFVPGLTGPCPGAYQMWEAWDVATSSWADSCVHSQVVDSLIVYRRNHVNGPVQRVDVRVIEGNSGGGTFVDVNGVTVSRGKVRNDRVYQNVIEYTALGDAVSNSCNTTRKIRGWGIDLQGPDESYCDPGRIRTVVISEYFDHPSPLGPDPTDIDIVTELVSFASLTQGNFQVTTNSSAVQVGGALPSETNPWIIPPGPHPIDPVYIEIDLLAEHPLPVDGVTIDWQNGFVPDQYEVWWAGDNSQIHMRTVTLASGFTPPSTGGRLPVPTALGPEPSYPVRYIRLYLWNAALVTEFVITGFHYNFRFGTVEDGNDVAGNEPGTGAVGDVGSLDSPAAFLITNYPNPFPRVTVIEFDNPGEVAAQIRIVDVNGRLIKRLASPRFGPGRQRVVWDGRDERGRLVASGVYFYELRAGDVRSRRAMVLTR